MLRHSTPLHCLALGLLVTLAQIALAVGFAHPEGSLADRYCTLAQHDSYWFANIVERGYNTTLPPVEPKEMEVSNVAFFPAYPLLASGLIRLTNLSTYVALLVVAQAAAWGFWTYFFLFGQRWAVPLLLQAFGALAIVAHPAGFYLVAGYSESLFLMTLAGFIYWNTQEGRWARALAVVHGCGMSATRIVGLPCAAFPVVHAFFQNGGRAGGRLRDWIGRYRAPLLVMLLSTLGGVAFFSYCQVRWGRWDLYMLTQGAGWGVEADYLAVFKMENYRWAIPPLYDTLRASQFTSAVAVAVFLAIALGELLAAALRRGSDWRARLGLYFCAGVIYYISLAGVASVQMESMLRYDLCVHALVVLGLLHFLRQCRMPPVYVRALAMGAASVACAAGLGLQGYYVWNFTQGNWVA